MKRIITYTTVLTLAIVFMVPLVTIAQQQNTGSGITISGIFARLAQVLNLIIPLLLLAATVVFLSGVVRYITAGDDEQKIGEARNIILWGIVALAAMVAVWGLVYLLTSAIFGTTNLPGIPGVNLDPFL